MTEYLMTILFLIALVAASFVAVFSKLFFLSPKRAGYWVWAANLFYETASKKYYWTRCQIDMAILWVLTAGWLVFAGWGAALTFALLFTTFWIYALHQDITLRIASPGEQERKLRGRIPLPLPRLVITLNGPVWERGEVYNLGDWPLGHQADLDFLILNPTTIYPQYPLRIELTAEGNAVKLEKHFESTVNAPQTGQYVRLSFSIKACRISSDPVFIRFVISMGSHVRNETLRIGSIFELKENPISAVEINRWKGGAKAGFAWRGDMDLYDPATFQSVQGLKPVLEMCRRYRIASTMCLSGRLSLVKEEHAKFCRQLGLDRHTSGIDGFIHFLQNRVTLQHVLDFPYDTPRPYAMELANHMYVHIGTHSAMDEGNGWKSHAKISEGYYAWQTEKGSFAEQRDNARSNSELIEKIFNFKVKSWGVPGRANDKNTPKALEAAGVMVASDSDASQWANVMQLPPPHHPEGCNSLVELTKKYPGDSDNAYKIAMIKYWMNLAHRKRQTFVFMAHQHVLQYEGVSCLNLTDHVLRHVLEHYKGDFYVTTLFGLGQYWDRVLCPKHRWVTASPTGNGAIEAVNSGPENLEGIPVEISFDGGKNLLVVADLPPGKTPIQLSDMANRD